MSMKSRMRRNVRRAFSNGDISRATLGQFLRLLFFSVALAIGFVTLFLALAYWTQNPVLAVGAEVGYWILAMGPVLWFWLPRLFRMLACLPQRFRHHQAVARRFLRSRR